MLKVKLSCFVCINTKTICRLQIHGHSANIVYPNYDRDLESEH